MEFKVLSYNVHKGLSWSNQDLTIIKIKEMVESTHADFVFLQEVVGKNEKHQDAFDHWPEEAQFEFLAGQMWPNYAYAKNSVYVGGHHGNAILSRYPIIEWKKEDISTNKWENRGLLRAKVEIPADQFEDQNTRTIILYCLHLNLFHGGRKRQYEAIKLEIEKDIEEGHYVIVAGDFNDWNKKSKDVFEDILKMKEVYHSSRGDYAKTFPAQFPVFSLDRIYVKNIEIVEAWRGESSQWSELSDHLPLMANLKLKELGKK